MNNRVEKLLAKLRSENLDAILVTDAYNRRYLSGFTGSRATLYISERKRVIITDFRYMEQVKRQCPHFEAIDDGKSKHEEVLYRIIKEDGANLIAFETAEVTYESYQKLSLSMPDIQLIPGKKLVEEHRMIKQDKELKFIQEAQRITDAAFEHILSFIKPGITEIEAALELEFFMRSNGADKLAFDVIMASGINSSMPHAYPTDKRIEKGDLLTMDFGCVYGGYCSDMTRTIIVGKGDQKQKAIYETVLKAQLEVLGALKAGMSGVEADKIARDIIYGAGYEGMFGHGLGHSVGLYIHEDPRLSPSGLKEGLKENTIVTVEPGIYVPDFGGVRIEDLVCVKQDGIHNFTASPKELIQL